MRRPRDDPFEVAREFPEDLDIRQEMGSVLRYGQGTFQ